MKGLVFDYNLRRIAIGKMAGFFGLRGYFTRLGYLRYRELPDPVVRDDDWVVLKTAYCGICGSDTKQAFLHGNWDNPITSLISWPHVLGHEVVGIVDQAGPKVKNVKPGDWVALYPSLSCRARGLELCSACQKGQNYLCRNFTKGKVAPGIHTGNSRDGTGGFADYVPAHESMLFKIPEGISWQQAVLADPFGVAFHSVLKVMPFAGSTCVVYGCGTLGLMTVQILKTLFKDIKVLAVARFPHQAEMARSLGADLVLAHQPTEQVIEQVAKFVHCDVYHQQGKRPWLIEGADFMFDTVGSFETLETGIRIVKSRDRFVKGSSGGRVGVPGTIAITGVAVPKKFEWTPLYFKEISLIGCNAYAMEDFEGIHAHAYEHFFRLMLEGRIDPTPIVTHEFPMRRYQEALIATVKQAESRAVKVVLSHPVTEDKGQ